MDESGYNCRPSHPPLLTHTLAPTRPPAPSSIFTVVSCRRSQRCDRGLFRHCPCRLPSPRGLCHPQQPWRPPAASWPSLRSFGRLQCGASLHPQLLGRPTQRGLDAASTRTRCRGTRAVSKVPGSGAAILLGALRGGGVLLHAGKIRRGRGGGYGGH